MTNPIVFSPIQISELSNKSLNARREAYRRGGLDRGLPLYSKKMDIEDEREDGWLPLLPGEMATIIARPGHGKSSFMMRWARARSHDIRKHRRNEDETAARRVVVYATYEQTAEDLNAFHIAAELKLSVTAMAMGKLTDEQYQQVERINANRMADPLWFIGHSLERRAARPVITVAALQQALLEIENWQEPPLIIDAVFVDYLQRMPYDDRENKTVGVSNNLDALKNMAQAIAAPVVVGVQASRDVDKRDDPAPEVWDGQWTSNIEQSSDRVISLFRPALVKDDGELYKGNIVTSNTMYIRFLKQKLGPANFARFVDFDPRYNVLNDVELKHVNLND